MSNADSVNSPLIGVDFTSTPSRRKAITVAHGYLRADGTVQLDRIDCLHDWPSFEALLNERGDASNPTIGAFDLPFGLPRELVKTLGWPDQWPLLITHCATFSRAQLRDAFKSFCDARPVGNKFAHRATDGPAGSSPSMKWVNPPVAYMFHEGAQRILTANWTVPFMHLGRTDAIALEAYPGLLARSITNQSYKSDDKIKQTPQRKLQRELIVNALLKGEHFTKNALRASDQLVRQMIQEPGADLLDAVLCLMQAGWAAQRRHNRFGLPKTFDLLEGWIVGA
jgi:Protein of unknown function (DUF429)